MSIVPVVPDPKLPVVPGSESATLAHTQGELGPVGAGGSAGSARGQMVGRYLLLERIGAGAMGVVFAAYDPKLDRKVALKLLQARRASTAQGQARMLREAQALARLAHPNVVTVHDAGTHGGQVFLAMEYIDGEPLGAWMARPRRWREVRDVFVAAGRGLAAAHAAGLVHRDFKPDNVMIDRAGRVRVMDFGLARAEGDTVPASDTDETGAPGAVADSLATPLTRTGVVMGTPAYMSPEQHAGLPADARSDQFGFCVAMWEALYGERPFAGESVPALALATTEGRIAAPPPGRRVPAFVRRALTRGLQPDPQARWPAMAPLLAALQRDPGRRRLALAGVGATAVAGLFVAAPWQTPPAPCADAGAAVAQMWSPARRDQVRAALAGVGLEFAAATADRVVERLGGYARRLAQGRRAVCLARREGGALAEVTARAACLDHRQQAMDELVKVFEEPDADVVTAAVQATLDLPDVATCADPAALARTALPPASPGQRQAVEAVATELAQARALLDAGRARAALDRLGPALDRARATGFDPIVAEVLVDRAGAQIELGRFEPAARDLREGFRLAVTARHDAAAARAASWLTYVVGYRLARPEAGAAWSDSALGLARRLEPGGLEEALALHQTAAVLDAQGDHEAARADYERALQVRRGRLGELHPDVARTLNNLGNVYLSEGHYDEAAQYYRKALDVRERLFGADHPEVTGSLNNLALVLRRRGELDEAAALLERAVAITEAASGSESADLAQILSNLAGVERARGRLPAALALDERALQIRKAQLGPQHPDVGDPLKGLAASYEQMGELERARELAARALALYEAGFGPTHPSVLEGRVNLARVLVAMGKARRAREVLEAAVGEGVDVSAAEPVVVAEGLLLLAELLQGQPGQADAARQAATRAAELYRAAGPGFADRAARAERLR